MRIASDRWIIEPCTNVAHASRGRKCTRVHDCIARQARIPPTCGLSERNFRQSAPMGTFGIVYGVAIIAFYHALRVSARPAGVRVWPTSQWSSPEVDCLCPACPRAGPIGDFSAPDFITPNLPFHARSVVQLLARDAFVGFCRLNILIIRATFEVELISTINSPRVKFRVITNRA